jgi:two-component system, LuxR family, sensor kinase FixL
MIEHASEHDAQTVFAQLIEASPAGTVIADDSGRIVWANSRACHWLGYSQSELIGMSVEELVPPAHRHAHARHTSQYMNSPVQRPIANGRDLVAQRKDGTQFLVDISLHPIQLKQATYVVANMMDAASRRGSEKWSDEKLSAIGEMVSGLSHECRNAMQRARACLDLMELDLEANPALLDLAAPNPSFALRPGTQLR